MIQERSEGGRPRLESAISDGEMKRGPPGARVRDGVLIENDVQTPPPAERATTCRKSSPAPLSKALQTLQDRATTIREEGWSDSVWKFLDCFTITTSASTLINMP